MEEVSTLLDANPALKIVFATTSLYSQTEVRNRLRHEAAFYTMHPMSFREFLSYESILDKDPIPLEDILANHHDLVKGDQCGDEYCADLPELSGTWMLSFLLARPGYVLFPSARISEKRDLPGFAFGGFYFDE